MQQYSYLCTVSVHPPDLVIALMRDKVILQLAGKAGQDVVWQSAYPIQADFIEAAIAGAMDSALMAEDMLIDDVRHAEILIIDRPAIFLPEHLAFNEKLKEIVSKYLVLRSGDVLVTEQSGDIAVAYQFPTASMGVFADYYAGSPLSHIISVIWSSIQNNADELAGADKHLFFIPIDRTLLIMSTTNGRLTFAKTWTIHEEGDALYFATACHRMLKPDRTWLLEVSHSHPTFNISQLIENLASKPFVIDQKRTLNSLPELIARHRSCAS